MRNSQREHWEFGKVGKFRVHGHIQLFAARRLVAARMKNSYIEEINNLWCYKPNKFEFYHSMRTWHRSDELKIIDIFMGSSISHMIALSIQQKNLFVNSRLFTKQNHLNA